MKVLSIIIPVYNERKTLRKLLRLVEKVDLGPDYGKEIIVIDDCSTDGSRDIVAGFKHKTILQKHNGGKGKAVLAGLKAATGDYTIIQDADLEYDPRDYVRILKSMSNGTEVVYGSRFLSNKRERWAIPTHYIGNRVLSFVTSCLYLQRITDMETCYKCFTKDVRQKLLKKMRLNPSRFDLEPEITAKTIRLGYKIKEVPIRYKPRDWSEGKKINWKDGLKALLFLVKYRVLL
jgi:dolichol-phosphate mannosyltransferase